MVEELTFRVLCVCVGNVCRSPLAERLLSAYLDETLGDLRDRVIVSSAGVRALVGNPMDPSSVSQLARLGGNSGLFVSRQLTAGDLVGADLVLTASKSLRSRVLEQVPGALHRTFTLREFASLAGGVEVTSPAALVSQASRFRATAQVDDYDVHDPIGASEQVHREVADVIDSAVSVIALAIASAVEQNAADLNAG